MTALLLAFLLSSAPFASSSVQTPNAPQPSGPAKPRVDPVTVRGCVKGDRLRIVEHDVAALAGVKDVRLKGRRGVLKLLRDQTSSEQAYVEVTGQLDIPANDRVETRAKRKIGSRTTVSVGAAAEQNVPDGAFTASTLTVEAFVVISPTCPVNR